MLFHHHFGISLATLFASRTRLKRQSCHRRRQGGKCKYKVTLLKRFWKHISDIFKTRTTFFNVFSKRCSSHAFLVYLYTLSEGFSTHFLCHVICARSDLDRTGMAQTHVLPSERSEKLQKNITEKLAIWSYILNGIWHHFGYMFSRKSVFGAK